MWERYCTGADALVYVLFLVLPLTLYPRVCFVTISCCERGQRQGAPGIRFLTIQLNVRKL